MSEMKEYTDPLIEFRDEDEDGHWVDGKLYLTSEWKMRVILTRRIKPFPNRSIVRNVKFGNILHKLENEWFSINLNRPDTPHMPSAISEEYMREHPEEFHILYEPGVIE